MSNLDEVVAAALAVLEAHPSALVTDVDGTLSRIASRPEDAYVGAIARDSLERLVAHLDLLAVVTGREHSVARRMVGVEGLTYIGSYALDRVVLPEGAVEAIIAARDAVEPYLARLPGVRLETKDVSFALHFRNSPDPEAMRTRILSLLEPIAASADAKLLEGKLVIEVAPDALPDKGTAFADLMQEHGIHGSVFVGDDLADTAIFREIRRRRLVGFPGLAVGVIDDETPRAVLATSDVQLAGVDEVEAFLAALAALVLA